MFGSIIAIGFAVELLKLAELFLERHPSEKSVNLCFYAGLGGRRYGGKHHKDTKAQRKQKFLAWACEFLRQRSPRKRASSGAKKNTARRRAFVSGFGHRTRS